MLSRYWTTIFLCMRDWRSSMAAGSPMEPEKSGHGWIELDLRDGWGIGVSSPVFGTTDTKHSGNQPPPRWGYSAPSGAWYLVRYHDIDTSDASGYRVCKLHGMARLPNRDARRAVHTRRDQKQAPGHHVQVDVKFLALAHKKRSPVCAQMATAASA